MFNWFFEGNLDLELKKPSYVTCMTEPKTVINLYHDWKQRLFRQWMIDGENLVFKEGELMKAIAKGHPIDIQNGLWDDKDFKRAINHSIPSNIALIDPPSEGYQWDSLIKPRILENELKENSFVLNPTCLSDFFNRYEYNPYDDNSQKGNLVKKPGIIESSTDKPDEPLRVNLTRALSEDEWALLLSECKRFNKQLDLYCAPGVLLPKHFMDPRTSLEPKMSTWNGFNLTINTVIARTDPDITVAILTDVVITR